MEYKVSLGAEVRTKDIDKQVKDYKGNINVGVNPESVISGIDTALKGYKAAPIQVGTTLVTSGITEKIKTLNKEANRKNIKVGIDPVFDGIETAIGQQTFNTKMKVGVQLNWSGVAAQIAKPDFGTSAVPKLMLDVDINDETITAAMNDYLDPEKFKAKRIPIFLKPHIRSNDWTDVETTLQNYEAKNPIRANVVLKASAVNKAINEYNKELAGDDGKRIIFNAVLRPNAIDDAIKSYIQQYPDKLNIPINFKLSSDLDKNAEFDTALKQKLEAYDNMPFEVPVRLRPAKNGFKDKISKISVDVDATLANADGINNALEAYSNNPIPISAKLVPAAKGFTSEITKTPVQLEAELSPTAINNAITNPPKGLAKLPIGITIKPENKDDINNQVKQLAPLVAEALEVNVKLNEQSVNTAISGFTPTATLEVKPNLAIEEVDDKIRTYVPKEQVKVNVLLDDSNIDPNTGKQIERKPIEVNVKLNRESINTQIRDFKTKTKIKVGVKLDFASHKDEDGKEIQKGVAKQIKDYDGKTKIRVGIQLDDSDIATQIGQINTNAPVLLGVQLDPDGVKKVENQIDNLRQKLEDIGNSIVNISGNIANNNSVAGSTQQAVRKTQNIISNSAKRAIRDISSKEIEEFFEVSDIDSNAFEDEMNNLVRKWTNNKGNVVDIQIETKTRFDEDEQQNIEELSKAHVTYRNAANESIKKTLEWKQIGVDDDGKTAVMGWVEGHATYRSSIEKTKAQTDKFVKQQKKAVGDLTNQINQINRAAVDQNASRPIKEKSHLDSLENKYREITSAIAAMGNASRDTFDDEQNRVKRLISEYKSMKSEFQNAENVANKLTGTDYQSGRNIAEQNLAEFETKAKDYAAMSKTLEGLKTSFGKVGDASSLKEFNNELRVAKAELAKVKAEANAADLDRKLSGKVSKLTGSIDDFKNANNEVVNFTAKIDNADVSIESLLNDLSQVKTKADFDAVSNKFDRFKEAAKNAGIALNDTVVKAKTVKDIKNKLGDVGFNGFTQEIGRAHADVESLEMSSNDLSNALLRLDNAMNAINTADEQSDMKALVAANEEYEESLKRLYSIINLYKQVQGDAYGFESLKLDKESALSKLNGLFESGSGAAKKFGSRMAELKNKIHECANDANMKLINKEIKVFEQEVKNSKLSTKTIGTGIKEQIQRYTQYLSVAEVIMYATQALRDMFEQVKLIDSAMTELKKVTNETDSSYNQFLNNVASRAKELGTTIDGLVSSTADFARLGYSFEEAQGLAEVANVYAVVGDEIEGVEDATQSLVSTLAAFRHEIGDMSNDEFALSIVDKMNEVANNYAISSGGLGQALQRSASSMAAANNTLDETIALITAANEVAQNPEKVGNAFKTMSMRIRGAKTELEEAGESTDGMAESTASLRQEMLALSGVDIMLNENTFKSTYQIMDELSHKWEGLSDIAQATIIELVAGKHQGNVFSSLMANFDTARAALDTSLASSGSAMAEHAKWSESLEARLNKLKAAWQGLSQAFMNSDFLKLALDGVSALVEGLTALVNVLGTVGTTGVAIGIFALFKNWSVVVLAVKKAIVALSLSLSLSGGLATAATVAKTAVSSLWGVIASHPILAAVAAIGLIITAYNHFTESAEELADRIEETTTKYKEQHSELSKLKGDYDTSKEDSMISRYGELSKGVNELGENLALTADEYAEYQSIVEQIAGTNPDLIAGYNSQGDAILSCAGDVDKLAESYRKLISAQNNEVLKNGADIFKDFKNDLNNSVSGLNHGRVIEGMDTLEDILGVEDIENAVNNLSGLQAMEISKILEENGIKRDILGSGERGYETFQEHIINAVNNNRKEVKNILDEASADIEAYAEDLSVVTNAYFEQAFLGGNDSGIGDYSGISDKMQNIISQVTSNFDSAFYQSFLNSENPYEELSRYYNNFLMRLSSLDSDEVANFEAAFDLKTKFNGGEISYGEYVNGIKEAESLVDRLGLHDEVEKQIKLSLGLNDTDGDGNWSIEQYDQMLNRLTSEKYGIQMDISKAEAFLNDLTASEYSVAVSLILGNKVDLSNFSAESLRTYIEEQAKINDALNFKMDISVEKEGVEALNTALTESVSAAGLSGEALESLQSRYAKLEDYDPSRLFERTAQGIHINRDEFNKLEKKLADSKLNEIDTSLETLTKAYEDTTEKIRTCSDETERNALAFEQARYVDKIKELSELQAQYEGLTSSYNNWVNAQAAGEEGDVYDDVLEKLKSAKELRKQGLVGTNEFAAAVEFMSGKDTSTMTIDQIVSAYDAAIPKMNRYFTESSKGAQNLLKDLNGMNKEWAYINDEGAWVLDIPIEDAATKLGISVDALESVLGKGSDYGLTINYDSVYETADSLEELYTKAESANKKLKELGHTDLTFSFKSTSVKDLETQIEKAQKIFDNLKEADLADDGKINLSVEGAEDARLVLETLMLQKQEVTKPAIMSVSLAMIGDENLGNVVKSLQDLQTYQNVYEIQIATGADTSETEAKIQEIAGGLKTLKDENPEIFAKLGLDTEEFDNALSSVLGTDLKAVNAKLDPTSIEIIQGAISGIDTTVLADVGIGDTTEIDNYDYDQEGKLLLTPVVSELTDEQKHKTGTITYTAKFGGFSLSEVNGTANANGTAFAHGTTGRAFKQGDWRIKGSGTALGGELGMETLVRDGHFYTIGDNGAEFFKYKQGDIIFNHKQTEELFKNGKVTSGGGRGRMFANGSAFVDGKSFKLGSAVGGGLFYTYEKKEDRPEELKDDKAASTRNANGGGNIYPSGGGGGGSSSKDKESEFEEKIDWIETLINRIEKAIDKLNKKASSVYKTWSTRNEALAEQIEKVGEEIDLQQQAYDRYLQEANDVGLDEEYASKVRDGTIDIEKITDEDLKKKIDEYKQWYDKAIDAKDAVEDLKEKESELYAQRFENIQSEYDGILQGYEHTEAMLNEYISQAEAKGNIISKEYYKTLIDNEKSNIDTLKQEQEDLIAARDKAVEDGKIEKYSEEWYNMCAEIDSVTQAIEEGETAILEYEKTMRELDWQVFDLMQERIAAVAEEANFLIELMSNKKLYDDDGKLTSEGLATMALHGQNYDTYMYQADEYAREIEKLNAQIAEDPYNQDLINRRNELIDLQRESILAAEEEKNAIRDMVEEGINLELDALQELIDKKNEALESERDLYEYQKKVKEQTEEIADLEKQMAAYSGDDSEEAKQKIQQIKVDLETAREDLYETEWDKYIEDTSAILDNLYTEYELILNTRLDNIDYLLESVIESINTSTGADGAISVAIGDNAASVKDTLISETDKVGLTLSTAMNDIWSNGDGNAKSVLTLYGEDFKSKSATIITTLNGIMSGVNNMVSSLNNDAKSKTTTNKTSTSAKKNPTSTTKTATVKKSSGDGTPKIGDKVKFVSGQYYYDSQGKKPLGSSNQGKYVYITNINKKDWATHGYHISTGNKLGKGDLGWLKLNQLSGYADGKHNFLDDEIAWTQEGKKREFIVRPSDGAILTPIAKRDSVLTPTASNNIWNMANSPAEFIKENLNLGSANVPNNSAIQNSYTQYLDKVVFNLPNVKNYDELLSTMKKDKNFERLVSSFTIDAIAGKSSLAKGKSIR